MHVEDFLYNYYVDLMVYKTMLYYSILLCYMIAPCCCYIVYTQVDSEWNAGNREGAREASRMARIWGYVSLFTGIGIIVASFVLGFISLVINI